MQATSRSLRLEHDDTLQRLTTLSRRAGPVGIEAGKALTLFKQHLKREEEFILPPLTLLQISLMARFRLT